MAAEVERRGRVEFPGMGRGREGPGTGEGKGLVGSAVVRSGVFCCGSCPEVAARLAGGGGGVEGCVLCIGIRGSRRTVEGLGARGRVVVVANRSQTELPRDLDMRSASQTSWHPGLDRTSRKRAVLAEGLHITPCPALRVPSAPSSIDDRLLRAWFLEPTARP